VYSSQEKADGSRLKKEIIKRFCSFALAIKTEQMCPNAPSISNYQGKST
jgi:hypothetical protein